MRRAAILLFLAFLAVSLTGCKLVDQRTFDRTADRPPRPHAPPVALAQATGPEALVSFPASAPASDWADILRTAAGLARSRKADVVFRVEAAVPPNGTPATQEAALAGALGVARQAAEIIVGEGFDRSEVELGAAADASVTRPVIRIFVR